MLWCELPAFPGQAVAGLQDDFEGGPRVHESVVRSGAFFLRPVDWELLRGTLLGGGVEC